MTESDIYKIFKLRCPVCSFEYEGEIECLQSVSIGDKVLDSCSRCGFLGDVLVVDLVKL